MPRPRKVAMPTAAPHIQEKTEHTEDRVVILRMANKSREGTQLNPVPNADVYSQAANLVRTEKLDYELSSQGLRDSLKRAYKNYLGVFDEPYDPYTGRKKIFSPLTHNIVDSVAKPVSVDSKAIHILPITQQSVGKAKVLNMVLPYFFQEMGFDDIVKELTHRTAWLGSQVTVQDWFYEEIEVASDKVDSVTRNLNGFAYKKEYKTKDGDKTRIVVTDRPRIRLVNLMDVYMPVTAESLHWACQNASVILRSVQTVAQVQSNPLYDDYVKANIKGRVYETSNRYDSTSLNQYAQAGYIGGENKTNSGTEVQRSQNAQVTIFERFGVIPKSWITADANDSLINVPAIITCASEGNGDDMKTLCVRLSPFGAYGPFEETWFNKVPNRWYGEGLGERLVPLQAHHNEIINNRRNNEILVQHRMFIYRKGKVDPRQFTARPGGGIAVENMDDIMPLVMPDISASSFNEDTYIETAAQRLAGAASTPIQKKVTAAEINNIQANSNLTYNELQDTIESYLERLLLHHVIPLLKKYFKEKRNVPIDLPVSELMELDTLNGYAPLDASKVGRDRFLYIDDASLFDGEFAVTVDIDGASVSRTQQIAAIQNAIAVGAKVQDSGLNVPYALRKMNELAGLYDDRLYQDAQQVTPTGVTNPNFTNGQQAPGVPGQPMQQQPQAPQQAPQQAQAAF